MPLPAHGRCLLLLLGWLAAAPARAEPEPSHPLLRPGTLDLRVNGGASFFPPSFEAGVSAELGIAPIRSGTLSLGAELGLRQCLLACALNELLYQRNVSNRDLLALGRLGYHLPTDVRDGQEVDLYGLLLAGVMEARTTVTAPGYRYEGHGRGPVFGLGVGGSTLLSSRVFVGGEARLRLGIGTYDLTLTRGAHEFTEGEGRWVRLGLSTVIFVGVRLF